MVNVAAVRFCAFFFGLLGLLFLVIAIPTHHWYHGEVGISSNRTITVYGGIFESCREHASSNGYTCISQRGDGYIKATKVFLVLAIVEFIVIVIYVLIMAFTRGIYYKVLGSLLLVAGLFAMVAMSIYTDRHSIAGSETSSYGYSFGLGWASMVFTFVSGVFCFFADAEYQKI